MPEQSAPQDVDDNNDDGGEAVVPCFHLITLKVPYTLIYKIPVILSLFRTWLTTCVTNGGECLIHSGGSEGIWSIRAATALPWK